MRFLDRFICKNPKQKQSDHGGSIMQRTIRMAADPSKEILGVCVWWGGGGVGVYVCVSAILSYVIYVAWTMI